jgi:hypothetical protein
MNKPLKAAAAAAMGIGVMFAAPTAVVHADHASECAQLAAGYHQLEAMGDTQMAAAWANYAQMCGSAGAGTPAPAQAAPPPAAPPPAQPAAAPPSSAAPPPAQPAAAPPAPGQQGDTGNPYRLCIAQGTCNASGGPAGTPAEAPAPPADAPAPAPLTEPNPAIAPSIDNALGAPPPLAPPGPVIAGPPDNNGYPGVTTPSDQWQPDNADMVDPVTGGPCSRASSPTCVPKQGKGDGLYVGTNDDCLVGQDGDNCIPKNKPPNTDNLAPPTP